MRFALRSSHFFAAPALTATLLLAACSAGPNPLGGLQQYGDAGSNGTNPEDPGNTNNAGDDDSTGHGSTPSPPSPGGYVDASAPSGDDAGTPAPTNDSGTPKAPTPDAGTPTSDSGTASPLLARCVSDLNSYRSQAGVTALTESSALEAYGALAAASDAQSGTTHGYFNGNQGSNVSAAESELPAWPLNQYASQSDLVDQGVAAIFNQGPGATPYQHLVDPTFTQAGCGVATTPDGNVWVTFEYK